MIRRYQQWLASVRGKQLVIVELGAGTAIATIRWFGEKLASERTRTTLVRINPDARDADEPAIPVRMTALEALTRIEEKLPEAFKAGAKAGERIQRPTAGVLPVGSGVGLEAVSARDPEMLKFDVAPVAAPGKPAWWSSSALTSGSRAVTQPNLNAPTIREIGVPIPPRSLQAEFTHRCAMARELCQQQLEAVAIAEKTFQSLRAGVF